MICPDCGNVLRSCCDSIVGDNHMTSCPVRPNVARMLLTVVAEDDRVRRNLSRPDRPRGLRARLASLLR